MTPQNSPRSWSPSEQQTTSELSLSASSTLTQTPLNAWASSEDITSDAPLETATSKFQKKLKQSSNNFGEALIEVFGDLVELEIVTWVANEGTVQQAGNRLKTTINLIDGDIENEIGANFLQGYPYFELRDFHEQQCAKGALIIKENLETLVEMGKKVTDLLERQKQTRA